MFSASGSAGSAGDRHLALDDDFFAGLHAIGWIAHRLPGDRHLAIDDQRLEARAREFGDGCAEHAIEPRAGVFGGDCNRFEVTIAAHASNSDTFQPADQHSQRGAWGDLGGRDACLRDTPLLPPMATSATRARLARRVRLP
jgi:hypothetical protein